MKVLYIIILSSICLSPLYAKKPKWRFLTFPSPSPAEIARAETDKFIAESKMFSAKMKQTCKQIDFEIKVIWAVGLIAAIGFPALIIADVKGYSLNPIPLLAKAFTKSSI